MGYINNCSLLVPLFVPLLYSYMTLNSKRQRAEFIQVIDGRNAKIRGLWKRGDIFYARLKITYPGEDRAKVRRVPLKAATVPEARKEQRKLMIARDQGKSVTRERTPNLGEFAGEYIDRLMTSGRKRWETIKSERTHARFWTRELGHRRMHKITTGQIRQALDKRAAEGARPRTCNLALTVLRNIYAEAIADGLVDSSPCQNVKWRKVDKKERRLVTTDEFDRLCDAALKD